jgi:hypothetical protein
MWLLPFVSRGFKGDSLRCPLTTAAPCADAASAVPLAAAVGGTAPDDVLTFARASRVLLLPFAPSLARNISTAPPRQHEQTHLSAEDVGMQAQGALQHTFKTVDRRVVLHDGDNVHSVHLASRRWQGCRGRLQLQH